MRTLNWPALGGVDGFIVSGGTLEYSSMNLISPRYFENEDSAFLFWKRDIQLLYSDIDYLGEYLDAEEAAEWGVVSIGSLANLREMVAKIHACNTYEQFLQLVESRQVVSLYISGSEHYDVSISVHLAIEGPSEKFYYSTHYNQDDGPYTTERTMQRISKMIVSEGLV